MSASVVYLQFGTQMAIVNASQSRSLPAEVPYAGYYVGEPLTCLSKPCHKAGFFSKEALILFRMRKILKSQQLSSLYTNYRISEKTANVSILISLTFSGQGLIHIFLGPPGSEQQWGSLIQRWVHYKMQSFFSE